MKRSLKLLFHFPLALRLMKVVAGDTRIVVELLQHTRRCNRSKPHEVWIELTELQSGAFFPAPRSTSEIIAPFRPSGHPAVFQAEDCIETLSEKLQMVRDTEVRAAWDSGGGERHGIVVDGEKQRSTKGSSMRRMRGQLGSRAPAWQGILVPFRLASSHCRRLCCSSRRSSCPPWGSCSVS